MFSLSRGRYSLSGTRLGSIVLTRVHSFDRKSKDCNFEIGPLENLAKAGQVMVYVHEGSWDCMDHERDVAYFNQLWKENKAFWKVWK